MANLCCVCGKKIGFMDGYKTMPGTNEAICPLCNGIISSSVDKIWISEDIAEIESVKAEALALIDSKRQELQNPDKLQLYLESKVDERMEFLADKKTKDAVTASI